MALREFLRKYFKHKGIIRIFNLDILLNLSGGEPKRITYAELKAMINNFKDEVGLEGFDIVYRGVLLDQRHIAMKKPKGIPRRRAILGGVGRFYHLNLVCTWGVV